MSARRKYSIVQARPDVVVIGAMRSGTTTLHAMLDQVNEIAVPSIKEPNFFCGDDPNSQNGWDWYANLFDLTAKIRCEVSPRYAKRSLYPMVASRIAAANPDAKIVFIARDPVERAISQYGHSVLTGRNMPPPSELLNTDEGFHLVSASKYAYCLEPFRDHFEGQIEIFDFGDLKKSPQDFLHKFTAAIGIDLDTTNVAMTAENSSDDIARQPMWWGKLRASRIGETVRRHVPRDYVLRLKGALSRGWENRERRDVPPFSVEDRQRLIEALSDDVAAFRKTYGHAFSDWCL